MVISNCNVNIRFRYNPSMELYERIEGFKSVHDHPLEFDKDVIKNIPEET